MDKPLPLSLLQSLKTAPKSGREGKKRVAEYLKEEGASLASCIADASLALSLLAGVAEASPYLWRLVMRDAKMVQDLLSSPVEKSIAQIIAQTHDFGDAQDEAQIMRGLRKAKTRIALLLALADLGGVLDVIAITQALSDFADAAVAAALRFGVREAAETGKITPQNITNPEEGLGLFVLALGKHGAGELNYSSDIDLAVFYDPEAPGLASAKDAGAVAISLTKTIVKLLNERNADGYVQRVDLRLRPDPGLTPIAMPVQAALGYYESVGQNWERAAYIKARVVAGDRQAGAAFLKELTPFIWRKYFDYAAIADIHAMKRQIYAVRGHESITIPGHDVKLGRGGIREIEFFVQTQQLVYGGRRPILRGSRTLDMLDELAREGWVSAQAAKDLASAYCALRTIEHRIQMIGDEQTQKLPKSEEDLTKFASFCGMTRKGFDAHILKVMKTVETHYARLFEAVPGLASTAGSLVFTGVEDDPETQKTLKHLGFKRPEIVAETVRGWHFGRRPAVTTPRAREILTELIPSLLEAFGASSDPDGALLALDDALQKMPAAVELFSILKNNGDLRKLFAEILGTAPRLSDSVARSPHVLDVLVDPAFVEAEGYAALRARIAPRLEREVELEPFLDRARELARAERFLLGTRVLSRVLPLSDAGEAHTHIAETFLDLILSRVRMEFAHKHGIIAGAELVILGLGKAGSREMTANSDLDLVIIYDAPADKMSDGAKPLVAAEYFAKLTQRLIAALSAPMRTGLLYEIDLRLRPSGKKGTVATSLISFVDYQTHEAEIWEHMALTRARVLVGDAGLACEVQRIITKILSTKRDETTLRREAATMRGLMAQEKPGRDLFDVKDWPGGLVDCEFIAQVLTLTHAHHHPTILGLGTGETVVEAGKAGFIAEELAETLLESWRLQSRFTQATRLCLQSPFDKQSASPSFKAKLAALLDLPDFAILNAELIRLQKETRRIFTDVIGKISF